MTPDIYIPFLAVMIVSLYMVYGLVIPPLERWQEKRRDVKTARDEAETYGRRFGPK